MVDAFIGAFERFVHIARGHRDAGLAAEDAVVATADAVRADARTTARTPQI